MNKIIYGSVGFLSLIPRMIGLIFITSMILFSMSCKKESCQHMATLQKLYPLYKDGFIEQCTYQNEIVFCAELNAYDAPLMIYNQEGNPIGTCNYAWGIVDSICNQLENCETIYRVRNNIWGQPAIDRYGLGH